MAHGMHQHDTKIISIIAIRASICGTREYPWAWETVDYVTTLNDSALSSNFKKVGSLIVITLPKPHTQPRMPVDTPVALMQSYDLVMLISRH